MLPKLIRRLAVGASVLAAPAVFAMSGAGQASADPDLCVSGPYGYASACVEVPGIQVWYDDGPRGPKWHGDRGWHKGHWK
jgi:hypothetical protein